MTESNEKDMLSKVKQTFLRMASPFEYGSSNLAFDSALTVNIPPMLARADAAAAEYFCSIVGNNIFQQNDQIRLKIYHDLQKLLTEVIENLTEAAQYAKVAKRTLPLEDRINLFQYMLTSVQLLAVLAEKQAGMEPHFSRLSPAAEKAILPALQHGDDVLSEFEMQCFHCLVDFSTAAAPVLNKNRDACKNSMTKNDFERYHKAYAEYLAFFADFGIVTQKTEE